MNETRDDETLVTDRARPAVRLEREQARCRRSRSRASSPSPGARRRCFERYSAAFEPTLGPQEGPPEGYKGE